MKPLSHPGRLEAWFTRLWWQPRLTLPAALLLPLAWFYRALVAIDRSRVRPAVLPVPVIVVGNLVVGGAGKTPLVIALVQALAAAGWRPGIVSRGHGRRHAGVTAVAAATAASEAGDEPLLIRRRTGAPVFVGRQRVAAVQALCVAHPEVDVIVADDGLQHHALPRVAQLIVFDDRGAGNGQLLPAGPLREPMPAALSPGTFVVYTGTSASTPLPGTVVPRHAARVIELQTWATGGAASSVAGTPLARLQGRRLLALAGIGAPSQFFAMLEAAGLTIDPLPAPDHATYDQPPWPAGTAEVITTEKDAVKLAALPELRHSATKVWVLPLDCTLPEPLLHALAARLPAATPRPST